MNAINGIRRSVDGGAECVCVCALLLGSKRALATKIYALCECHDMSCCVL